MSVLEMAAAAAVEGGVRNWVDRRLGDSFPVSAAERLVEVALRCAAREDRPDMTWVAGKVSKVYLESWCGSRSFKCPPNSPCRWRHGEPKRRPAPTSPAVRIAIF